MKGLDRTQLKFIAICAMVCDHAAWGFVEFMSPLGQLMHIIGRLTVPTMCFFVAEGFRHTSSIKEYIQRMALFAVVAMLPFYLFFHEIYDYRQNIIFDLLLGLLLLTVLEHKRFNNMEENARLLKGEMETVEKKNRQLEKAKELAEEARQEAIAANAAKGKFFVKPGSEQLHGIYDRQIKMETYEV